ncbi:leucine-rich repeat containing [Chlorella sorokiniana]|uniref:Leucine-rich repeat containing n=1 Tax=Chlorella sorokiniana TaxID=3076 RepID=A0A2P6U4X4_CHLSO|nr:leucine-rich repeat containing [Chlorella sorokiniana]|eukprot:PRW61371.1 leucine-rich repeat containing [Chlorella sorokiniana]
MQKAAPLDGATADADAACHADAPSTSLGAVSTSQQAGSQASAAPVLAGGSSGSGGSGGGGGVDRAQAARLEGANRALRERLADALEELDAAHAQLRILQGLQQQLEDATPGAADLAAAALEQERVLQVARDARVLQLLRAKDEVIESFEARYAESRAEVAQLAEQLAAAQQAAETSGVRVRELVDDKARLRQQQEQAAAAHADAQAALSAQVAALQGEAARVAPLQQRVVQVEAELADARADLAASQRQQEALLATVDAANDAIVSVQAALTEQEQAVAQRDAEVASLQAHLARLLGLPDADVPTLHAARFGPQPSAAQPADRAAAARIAALEAANERLEMALVEATRSAAAAAGGASPAAELSATGSEADLVAELQAQLAVATGRLQAADERVAQLEKLLKVAEATVLHNEAQLQESLEARCTAEEQVYALRLDLEEQQALAGQLEAKLSQLAAAEQAALADAAEVRSALQAAQLASSGAAHTAGQQPDNMVAGAAVAGPTSSSSGSLGKQVGIAVSALVERTRALEQQLGQQQAALERAQQRPAGVAVAVQCDSQARADAAMQAEPGSAVPASTQTESAGQQGTAAAGPSVHYGQADPEQQQVAELTQQLPDSRLATVAAKAEQAAAQSKLQEAECQLAEQQAALAAAERKLAETGAHNADCACPLAQQLRSECGRLQAEVEQLRSAAAAAQQQSEARLADAVQQGQAQLQALKTQLAAMEGCKCELSELRSSAYAAVHHARHALLEHGSEPAGLPHGCEPHSVPQQLKQAVDGLLLLLQEQGELVAALQAHLQRQPLGCDGPVHAAGAAAGGSAASSLPLEASQRAVIRSLATQVAELQRQLEQAAPACGSPAAGPCPPPVLPSGDQPGDLAQLAGMLVLVRQQLAGLERIQRQLEAAKRSGGNADRSRSPASPASPALGAAGGRSRSPAGGASTAPYMPDAAHMAALLGTELPALLATVAVMEAEVRRMAAERAAEPDAIKCLPAPAAGTATDSAAPPAPGDMAQRKEKWKARCKELQSKLEAAGSAAQAVEAALRAQLADAERAAAEHAAQQASTVAALQGRVEELARAGAQLEGALQQTARQLADAAGAAEALQGQLEREKAEHAKALGQAERRLVAAEGALREERQRHASLAASVQDVTAGLHSSGNAEQQLRAQLTELAEHVAVLTAAQEAAKSEVAHKQQALQEVQSELAQLQAAHAALTDEKQQREGELVGRLEAMQHECTALLAVVERAEEQHAEVEERLHAQVQLLGGQLERHGDTEAAHLPAVHAGLAKLQSAAEGLEVRLLRLEAQAAVLQEDRRSAAVGQWATMVRSRRYRSAVQQLRDGLQAQLLDAQAVCQQQAAQLRQAHAAVDAARAECAALAEQLRDAEERQQQEWEQALQDRQQELAMLHQQADERCHTLQRQAEASAAAAVAEAEQRCRVEAATRVCQVEQRALRDLEAAEQQCAGLQSELETARSEFKRYQAMKAVEVRLLEQRVLQQLGNSGGGNGSGGNGKRAGKPSTASRPTAEAGGGGDGQPATLADLEAACGQEGIAAALREARLERLQREQLEADLAAAQAAGQQLGARARAAEQEMAAQRSQLLGEARAARERAERLAAELADCQQALKLAKGEGSRRLKELQALQRQAAEACENGGANGGVAAARLEAEHAAREAAEAQLREARQGLARKASLIRDLRAKVDSLEQALAAQDPAPLLAELEACQARLRQSQAACGSKEAAVRELRERLEQQTRLAHEQGVLEERGQQQAALSRLSQQLTDREAQVDELHQQLRQLHSELAAASAGLQATAASHSAAAEGAAARLEHAGRCTQQLAQAVRLLLETLAQLGSAVAAAADRAGGCDTSQADTEAIAAAAGSLAGLVGLDAEDIASVLLPEAGHNRPSCAIGELEAAAQQARQALQQAEAQLAAGSWQDEGCAALLAACAPLQERCAQLQAALAGATQQAGATRQLPPGDKLGTAELGAVASMADVEDGPAFAELALDAVQDAPRQHGARGVVMSPLLTARELLTLQHYARLAKAYLEPWCKIMQQQKVALKFWEAQGVLNYTCVDTGATKDWGFPARGVTVEQTKRYVDAVDTLAQPELDAVLVDGRFRVACALKVLPFLTDGAVLLVHDWEQRRDVYGPPLLEFYELIELVDKLAVLRRRSDWDREAAAAKLDKYYADPA